MPKLNLKQKDNELINTCEICLYSGETADITFSELDFAYAKASVKLNNIYIGSTPGNQIGIHSSKFKEGANNLSVTFYDIDNKIIKTLTSIIIKRPSVRGKDNIEEEFTILIAELEKVKQELEEIKQWRIEIDNERSGY